MTFNQDPPGGWNAGSPQTPPVAGQPGPIPGYPQPGSDDLEACGQCLQDIPRGALTCTHCGAHRAAVGKPWRRARGAGRWILAAAIGVLVIAAIGGVAYYLTTNSPEQKYLRALSDSGLRGEFAADRAAITAAENKCAALDNGEPPQGSEADRVAVEHYCPDYLDAFRVLETVSTRGFFTIKDYGTYFGSDKPCEGEGGYSDINASTQVVVTNENGDELARTQLGPGRIVSGTCQYAFDLDLREGSKTYIVAVGRRGETSYTWDEVVTPEAINLTLGDD